jgi:dTDP-4-amino-4,6-dideoxygalactose transaminase
MDELQAAMLRVKLPRLDAWNRRRREIAARYARAIAHPAITLPPSLPAGEDVAHLYVTRTPDRESLRAHLARAGIATDVHYPVPDHWQAGGAFAQGRAVTDAARRAATGPIASVLSPALPHTERACAEVLSLPCYPELTDAEVDAVAAACNAWQPVTRS